MTHVQLSESFTEEDMDREGYYETSFNNEDQSPLKEIGIDEFSEYIKFPGDIELAKKRADKHLLRRKTKDKKKEKLPFWIDKEELK